MCTDAISTTTHKFCRTEVKNDSSSLYSSIRYVIGTWTTIDNQRIRSLVADHILVRENLHSAVVECRTDCRGIADYCNKIKEGKFPGSETEVRAMSMICCLLIEQVSIRKNDQGNINVSIVRYGKDIESFEECIYILYDEEKQHYEPLYVVNMTNSEEKFKIFQRKNTVIPELLRKFIREELHDIDFEQSSCVSTCDAMKSSNDITLDNETKRISDMVIPMAHTTEPRKRKMPNHSELLLAPNVEEELSSKDNNIFNQPSKVIKLDTQKISDEDNYESMTVEKHVQTAISVDESHPPEEKRPTTDVAIISNGIETMKFEVEPVRRFLGRTKGDFIPKKATTRKDKPSEIRPPRYFPNRNGCRYLNLLIPETMLSAGLLLTRLEICIVTREIDGYTYIHPYFKFKGLLTDPQSLDLNPIYKDFSDPFELKIYSKLLRSLKLQLFVIMHVKRELMQCEQPLTIFSSSTSNENKRPMTKTFKQCCTLKKAYHLNDMRFAVTLLTKKPGETIFQRHNNMQYISKISKAVPREKQLCK